MELVVLKAGGKKNRREALVLEGESDQIVVASNAPVAHSGLARNLEKSPCPAHLLDDLSAWFSLRSGAQRFLCPNHVVTENQKSDA